MSGTWRTLRDTSEAFPCLVITVNGHLQTPQPDKTNVNSCSDPSGMKVWLIQDYERADWEGG